MHKYRYLKSSWGQVRMSKHSFAWRSLNTDKRRRTSLKLNQTSLVVSVLKHTPKRKHRRVVSAIEVHPMSCSSTNIYSHIYLHLARPSCRPLIGFGWVMSTIDRKYNLIRSLERQHWDGRYWKRTGMAINETTPTQCSIISIWFINYPWRWGFYLTRHANWQKETHTHRVEGNIS